MAVGGHQGPRLMTLQPHHLELAISQYRLGIPHQNVTKPRLYRQHLKKENRIKHHLSNLDNTFAKTGEICSFQEGVAVKPLIQLPSSSINFPHLHPLQAEPAQATTKADRSLPLRRRLCTPEALPDCRRRGGCPDARGPADLLALSGPCERAPPPAGWVVDG